MVAMGVLGGCYAVTRWLGCSRRLLGSYLGVWEVAKWLLGCSGGCHVSARWLPGHFRRLLCGF